MTIHGQFKDYKDNTIDVLIYKSGDITTYAIDDYLDDTHHLCFNGSDPVVISHECEDLFTPIISATCTIKLIANIWCGDILFSNGIGEIIARVTRTIGNDTELLFVGYVTPLTFSQDINKQHNEIDIVCYDVLGCLSDKTLSTGSTYEETLENAMFSSFKQILNRIGLYNNVSPSTYIFPNEQYNTQLYVDTSVVPFLDLRLSDNLWLGDSKDDETSLYDILLEVLKYTNSRIISIDGQTLYIIANNVNTNVNRMYYINTESYVDFPLMLDVLPKKDIANEQVTIDDCFNIIGVKCDLENLDEVVASPIDKDSVDSPYSNKQLYMTEYSCEEESEFGDKYEINWSGMVQSNEPHEQANITDYTNIWMRNWYIRYINNPDWTLYGPYTPSIASDGTYIRQYEAAGMMNDLYQQTETWGLNDFTPCNLYPVMLQFGKGNKLTAINNIEASEVKLDNYLILPCPETWQYIHDFAPVTDEYAYNYINAQLAKYETTPMVSYKSKKTVNYTPADPTVTNYIVISGKLKMIPSCLFDEHTIPNTGFTYRGISYRWSFQDWVHSRYVSGTFGPNYVKRAIGSAKDKTRWYYRRYWTKENPNQERAYIVHDADDATNADISSLNQQWRDRCAEEPGAPYYRDGILYSLDTDDMYSKQIGWGRTKIDKRNTTIITLNYVPILMCRLRIGDKYLEEIQNDGEKFPHFRWTTDPNAVFAISVQLSSPDDTTAEPTDYLIGVEHEIINTVTLDMNITGNPRGIAIPVKYDDKVFGDMEFQIVGPYNAVIESTNHYYRHATWFRSAKSWSEQNAAICVLNHVHSINIKEFKIEPYTDNAKNDTLNEGDLHYYSEDNKKYNNPKDDIEFKIVTALKPNEAAELNIATGISYNNPTDENGNVYTTDDKPEEIYIQTMYDLYSTPKKIVEYEATLNDNKLSEMYRTVYENDLMEHLDVQDFKSIVIGDELDLKQNRMKIKTREI